MTLVPFSQLMQEAQHGSYAVGYFETWNFESLAAVADAAQAARSPVLLGTSGVYVGRDDVAVCDHLGDTAALGLAVCRRLSVPACLLFNESPFLDLVLAAVDLGFGIVMYSDAALPADQLKRRVRQVVDYAHARGAAVEAEINPISGLPLAGGDAGPGELTDAAKLRDFVDATGVDLVSVNVGQIHAHGRHMARLDLERVKRLVENASVPLGLHGATSIDRDDLRRAVECGIRKVNIGSALKQAWLRELSRAAGAVPPDADLYRTVGSGLPEDVSVPARRAVQACVHEWMQILGSAGRAK